jgi:hypothetical protein
MMEDESTHAASKVGHARGRRRLLCGSQPPKSSGRAGNSASGWCTVRLFGLRAHCVTKGRMYVHVLLPTWLHAIVVLAGVPGLLFG